ncbi:16516_t:CDS:2 [Acaulospora colombiana]|uniref:16516_t:CDS:1 n=1 Tax=Acaulospora colombiana TaxID=27376 RepID=A0ACA9KPB2_9GLOM|nr:16516_t:CDS:2 [Acaulospora colombiana]
MSSTTTSATYKASDGRELTPSRKKVQVCIPKKKVTGIASRMVKSTKKSVSFSAEEESEGSRISEDDPEYESEDDRLRTSRKYPARSTVIEHKLNYSEELYYERFNAAFNARLERNPEKSTTEREPSSSSPKSLRRKTPKRKSSVKDIDYSEKRYYKKFESAMRTKIYYKNTREPLPSKRQKGSKGNAVSETVNEPENDEGHAVSVNEPENDEGYSIGESEGHESDDSVEYVPPSRNLRSKGTAR